MKIIDKAILIIDMPEKCADCKICASYAESAFSPREYWCTAYDNKDVKPYDKPDWCPLKSVPEKQLVWYDDEVSDWERGYNACLYDVLGE